MTLHTPTWRRRQVSAVLLALLALVGGCAQPAPPGRGPGPGPGPGTYKPDDVVLRVDIVDGFIPREYLITRLPKVSVYGDGRVITEGPGIYPSPALPNVLVQTISPAGVNALVTRALDHGVGSGVDFGQPNIMDAPSTRFAVLTDEGPLVSSVNALTEGDGGLTAAQRSARRALRDLLDDLSDLSKTLGQDAVDEKKPYQPKVLAAVSREWTAPDAPAQPERAWPGPTLPGGPVGNIPGVGCVTVTGDDLETVLDAARSANVVTPWTSDGRKWLVGFRPLLPEETSCTDLA